MSKVLAAIIALVSVGVGIFVYQGSFNRPLPEHALYYQSPRAIKPFVMTDHLGQEFSNQNLQGHWSWVFFGYTSCPDVCPTTLQELNFYYDDLQAISDRVQVLLVSVDPNRDTVEKLSQYMPYFNKEFKGLTADHSVLFPFARNLGLMYAISDDDRHESYLVDHSASIVLINPQGEIAAIFKPQHELGQLPTVSGEHLASDFAKIVALAN